MERARYLTRRLHETPDGDRVRAAGRERQDPVSRTPDNDRRAGTAQAAPLDRPEDRPLVELIALAPLRVPGPGEQPLQFIERGPDGGHPLPVRHPGDSGRVELPFHVTSAEPEFQAPAGEHVHRRHLAGEQVRVPERHVQHEDSQPDPFGNLGGQHQRRDGAGDPR